MPAGCRPRWERLPRQCSPESCLLPLCQAPSTRDLKVILEKRQRVRDLDLSRRSHRLEAPRKPFRGACSALYTAAGKVNSVSTAERCAAKTLFPTGVDTLPYKSQLCSALAARVHCERMLSRLSQIGSARRSAAQALARAQEATQCCSFAAGAHKPRRRHREEPAGSAAAPEQRIVPGSPGGGLAERPAGALARAQQEEWTPVRHESGQVYYWNKRTGKCFGISVCRSSPCLGHG